MNPNSQPGFDLTQLPHFFEPHQKRIALGRQRQAAVWKREKPDAWPIIFGEKLTPEQEKIPSANFKEAFESFDRMLCNEVRAACSAANGGSDQVPSIRVNFGVGTTLACLGLEQEVFPDKMPWPKEHLTLDQVRKLTPDDIQIRGSFARGLDWMRQFKKILGDSLHVYCMDTQGPFDLAHLVIGDEIFYLMNDDPPLLHHLMEICFQIGVKTHTWMKEAVGEPRDQMYHGNSLYMENGGIRICEDTTSLLSADAIREFAMPYTRRLAQHFGGAFIHYCGRNDHLTDALCEIPEVRCINFGHVPGREHDHVFEADMQRMNTNGKVYYGNWPLRDGESGRDFLKRMHHWSRQGCLLCAGGAAVGDQGFASARDAMDFWYGL